MKDVAFMGPSSTKGATIARAQAGDEGDRLPMPVRNMIDQSNAARAAASKPHHGGVGRGLVDEHQTAGSNMPCSRIQRRRARATSARFCSAARRLFLKLILCRSKKRHTALRLPAIRRLRIATTISSSIKSGCSAISPAKRPRAPPAARCRLLSAWPQCFPFRLSAASI